MTADELGALTSIGAAHVSAPRRRQLRSPSSAPKRLLDCDAVRVEVARLRSRAGDGLGPLARRAPTSPFE